jgi:hypothetical protein
MRPQGFGQGGNGLEDLGWNDMGFEPPKAAEVARDPDHDAFGDDVVEHPRVHPTGLTPVQSPVHHQQAELADHFPAEPEGVEEESDETAEVFDAAIEQEEEPAPVAVRPAIAAVPPAPPVARRRAPRQRSLPGSKGKAAFTLRLDPERHLKLRLACAVDGRSAQQLVTDALDRLLEHMPELDSMAAKAKPKG